MYGLLPGSFVAVAGFGVGSSDSRKARRTAIARSGVGGRLGSVVRTARRASEWDSSFEIGLVGGAIVESSERVVARCL